MLAVLDRKKARTPNALKTVSVLNAAIPVGGSGEPRNPSQESQRVSKKRLRKDVSEYHSAEEADEKIDTSPTRKSKLSWETSYKEPRLAPIVVASELGLEEEKAVKVPAPVESCSEHKESFELPVQKTWRKLSFSQYEPILPSGAAQSLQQEGQEGS